MLDDARPGPRLRFGKYPALVRDNRAPEGGPHRGEIDVEVPGILEDDPEGGPPRPMLARARPCFPPRHFFVPDVGDRVWVEFAAGDIDFPIWVGVFYPEGAEPKTSDDDAPTERRRVIRTAAGHVIELDDTQGAERIVLENAVGRVSIERERLLVEHQGATITLGDNAVAIQSSKATFNGKLLVLEGLIDWLKTHTHTGNLGSPTPLFPADKVALELDLQNGTLLSQSAAGAASAGFAAKPPADNARSATAEQSATGPSLDALADAPSDNDDRPRAWLEALDGVLRNWKSSPPPANADAALVSLQSLYSKLGDFFIDRDNPFKRGGP